MSEWDAKCLEPSKIWVTGLDSIYDVSYKYMFVTKLIN